MTVFNILARRLHVKSVCRYRFVRKTWLSTISAQPFVDDSHTAPSNKSRPKLLVTISREEGYRQKLQSCEERYRQKLQSCEERFERYLQKLQSWEDECRHLFIADQPPEQDKEGSSKVVLRHSVTMPVETLNFSYVNSPGDSQLVGGLMFSLCFDGTITIANPSTNTSVAFSPALPQTDYHSKQYVSLGFDPIEGKHKFLVSLFSPVKFDGTNEVERGENCVITVGDDAKWRFVKDGPTIIDRGRQLGQEICINGVIYFIADISWPSRGIGRGNRCMVAFDVRSESFQVVEFSIKGRFWYSPYPWRFVEFEGKVGIVDYPLSNRDCCYDTEDCEHALELYVLEDFQNQVWSLKFAALPPLPMKMDDLFCPKHKLVGTTHDEKLIFAVFEGGIDDSSYSIYGTISQRIVSQSVTLSFLFFDMKTGDYFRSNKVCLPEGFGLTGNIKITAMGYVEKLMADESESRSCGEVAV